jgi:hypothetical protein
MPLYERTANASLPTRRPGNANARNAKQSKHAKSSSDKWPSPIEQTGGNEEVGRQNGAAGPAAMSALSRHVCELGKLAAMFAPGMVSVVNAS